jgi:hypothetical protein
MGGDYNTLAPDNGLEKKMRSLWAMVVDKGTESSFTSVQRIRFAGASHTDTEKGNQ